MEQEILTGRQLKFLELVSAEPSLSDFYLTGGTALAAFYLRHRLSDDLDFFTSNAVDGVIVRSFIQQVAEKFGGLPVRSERVHDRQLFFLGTEDEELKIEFTQYPFKQFESPEAIEGIRVDSIRDLGANKLAALIDRFDPKDFVDLYFLLHDRPLNAIRADAETKFGITLSPTTLGGELLKVRRITALPKMVKPLQIPELVAFFEEQAKTLTPEVVQD